MAQDSDIKVLVGVSRAGDPSGDSEALIRKQLEEIAKKVKLSVQVQISKNGTKEGSLRTQVQDMLNGIGSKKPLSVSVQQINISKTALNSFKQQIQAVVNTLDISKGTSVTLKGAGNLGEFTKELANVETHAESTRKQIAELQAVLGRVTADGKLLNEKNSTEEELKERNSITSKANATLSELKKMNAETSDAHIADVTREVNEIAAKQEALEKDRSARIERELEEARKASDEKIRIAEQEAQKKADIQAATAEKNIDLKASASSTGGVFKRFTPSFINSVREEDQGSLQDLLAKWSDLKARIDAAQKAKETNPEILAGLQAESDALRDQALRFLEDAKAIKELADVRKKISQELEKSDKIATIGGGAMRTTQYQSAISDRAKLLQMRESGNINLDDVNKLTKNITSNLDFINKLQGVLAETPKGLVGKFQSMFGGIAKTFGSARIITTAIKYMKDMVKTAVEIDSAMTQLKIVTGATDEQMTSFLSRATIMAKELGQSVTGILSSIETFSRLGYNLEDSSVLAKYSAIMSNVAGVSNEEATTGITSIIKGYGMEVSNAEHVADVLVEVGQKYAVSAAELIEAYEKSGAALNASNTSFEKSAGLIAAANAAVQNSSTVGTAMKTISARIRGSKSELEELGEDTEELKDGFSKYAGELKDISGFDIMVEGTSNTFKDIFDIFEGISKGWDKLSDTQQARVSEILGGTRQLQVVSSILANWDDAAGAYSDAMDAAGVSTEANATYMDSIQGHLGQMKASYQELSATIVNSDLAKGIVDIGNALINVVTWLQKAHFLLPLIVTSFVTIKAMKTANSVNDLAANIMRLIDGARLETAQVNELSIAYMNLSKRQREVIMNDLTRIATSSTGNAADNAKRLIASFNGVNDAIVATATGAGRLKTIISSIGWGGWISIGISLISTLVGWFQSAHKSAEELIRDAEELDSTYKGVSDTISSDLKTLEDMQEEFDELSKGVDEHGKNISLTTAQYDRYREVVESVLAISPSLIEGYDNEGRAIANNNELLREAIDLKKQSQQLEADKYLSGESFETKVKGAIAEYEQVYNDAERLGGDFSSRFGDAINSFITYYDEEHEGPLFNPKDFYKSFGIKDSEFEEFIKEYELENGFGSSESNDARIGMATSFAKRFASEINKALIAGNHADGLLGEFVKFVTNDLEHGSELQSSASSYAIKQRELNNVYAKQLNPYLQEILRTSDVSDTYQALSPEEKSFISKYINSFSLDKNSDEDKVALFRNTIIDLINTLNPEGDAAKNGVTKDLSAVISLGLQLEDPGEISVGEYTDKLEEFQAKIDSLSDNHKVQIRAAFGIDSDSDTIRPEIDEWMSHAQSLLKDSEGNLSIEAEDFINGLSLPELELAYTFAPVKGGMSVDKFKERLRFENMVSDIPTLSAAQTDVEAVEAITSDVEKYASIYNDAMKQMAESGSISHDIIKSMQELGLDYTKYVKEQGGVLRLDAQAYRDFINELSNEKLDPIDDQIKLIETRNRAIEEYISDNKYTKDAEGNTVINVQMQDEVRAAEEALNRNRDQIQTLTTTYNVLKASIGDVAKDVNRISLSDEVLSQTAHLYTVASNAGESYAKLKDAVDEFNTTGQISSTTMKSLADSGLLQFLEKTETGYRINTDALFDYTNEVLKNVAETMRAAMAQDIYNLAIGDTNSLSPIAKSALSKYRGEIVETGNAALITAAKLGALNAAEQAAAKRDLWKKWRSGEIKDLPTLFDAQAALNKFFSGDISGEAQAILDEYESVYGDVNRIASDLGRNGGDSSSKSSTSSAPWEKELNDLEHRRKMELINEEEYYNALLNIHKRYASQSSKYKDDWDSLEETIFSQNRTVSDDWFNDQEHRIAMLENSGATADEIVAIYQGMVNRTNDLLDGWHKYGLDEDDEYYQQLLDRRKDYTDKIVEAQISEYEKLIQANENKITLTQNWMDSAAEQNDYAGLDTFSRNIVSYYRRMQDSLHAEAQIYRDKGLSDTSDEISALSNKWWEYEGKIKEVKQNVLETLSDMVSESNDIVDGFENVYKTLTDAANEYAEHGFLSTDSLQSILELGPQYLKYLEDENGQLVVNEQALQNVIRAKTEQLAADAAVAYAEKILYATKDNDIETLRQLAQAHTEASGSSFQYAYSVLEIARAIGVANGQSNELYDNALESIRKMESLGKTAADGVAGYWGQLNDDYVSQKDGIEGIFELVKEMIRWENEEMQKALEQQKEDYGDIVSLRKEALDAAKEDSDYNDDVAEKVAKIAKLQARINTLSLDDSRDAQAQKIKLEEEMRDLQKDLNKTQSDQAVDSQKDALDKMQEQYEDQKDDQIKELERELSSEEKLNRAARERISIDWGTLYTQLRTWNTEYGKIIDEELTNKWDAATEAVQRYGGALEALDGVKGYTKLPRNPNDIIEEMKANSLNWFIQTGDQHKTTTGEQQKLAADLSAATEREVHFSNADNSWHYDSPTGEKVYTLSNNEIAKYIVTKMEANAAAWNADGANKSALEEENELLAARLRLYVGGKKVEKRGGVWYLDNEKLFDKYHSGGIVGGGASFRQNEVLSLLEKGETVLDKQKEKGLYRLVDFATVFMEKFGRAIDTSPLLKSVSQMNNGLRSLKFSTPNIGEAQTNNVHFGDVYIYGANEDTLEKHREINRQFTADVLRHLGIKN